MPSVISGRVAGRAGDSARTSPETCTVRSSAWSASVASHGRWLKERAASTWRSSTRRGTTPACAATSPTLDELLERSDIVSLHVPLNESTRHLIGAAELALHEADGGPHQHGSRAGGGRERAGRCSRGGHPLRRWPRRLRRRAGGESPAPQRHPGPPCFRTSGVPRSRRGRAWLGSPARESATSWPGEHRRTPCSPRNNPPDDDGLPGSQETFAEAGDSPPGSRTFVVDGPDDTPGPSRDSLHVWRDARRTQHPCHLMSRG